MNLLNMDFKGIFGLLMAAALLLLSVRIPSFAETKYLPDVTADMSRASYWSSKDAHPDETLVTLDEIKNVNQDIMDETETGVWDMSAWTEDTYNGLERNDFLKEKAEGSAKECIDSDGVFLDGVELSKEEAMEKIYAPLIANCTDPEATESMDTGYAICTTRTTLRYFPTDMPLYDSADDYDFDLLHVTGVQLGEPLILTGRSADGKYYYGSTSYYKGWIPAADIALCKDRAEWMEAWNFADDQILVVYDDKITTETSNTAPETANIKLYMGTKLQLADRTEWENKINNRYAFNNYVVWMPIRQEDGSYTKKLALISEHCKVSQGYLPLTTTNLSKVILFQLGNTYGWGGMLDSQDCSGYVRAVYQCFGLELARDTSTQAVQPVKKYDLKEKTDAEKTEIIKSLPLGALLLFNGHAMLYLGHEGDKLYVISSVSNLVADGVRYKARGVVINTLDVERTGNRGSWLSNLHTAQIPYYNEKATDLSAAVVEGLSDVDYTGKAQTPAPKVSLNGELLKEYVHYTLSYNDNTEPGTASVTIAGKGNYEGTIKKTFTIREQKKEEGPVSISLDKNTYIYTGKAIQPKVTVKVGNTILKASDYDVNYGSGRKNVGSYKVTATLKNGYTGTVSASFKIIPKGATGLKLTKGKKSFTAKWKKQAEKMAAKQITGYQIQYATNKNFTAGKGTVTVKKYSSVSKKVSKLKKNKKYYVRIRTYMTVNKVKMYSEWSKAKTVVTK